MSPRARKQVLGIMVRQKDERHLTAVAVVALIPEAARENMSDVSGDQLWCLADRMQLPGAMPFHKRANENAGGLFSFSLFLAVVTDIPPRCTHQWRHCKEADLKSLDRTRTCGCCK